MLRKNLAMQIGDTDVKLLRIFKSVTECGGLSAAENELNIGRSTISKYISDLEIRLNMKLCNRGPAGFSLTHDGRNVLDATEELLSSLNKFQSRIIKIKDDLIGTLKISLFDQSASNHEAQMGKAIRIFTNKAPNVELELSLEPLNLIENKVMDGKLDIGILTTHRPHQSLDYTPLYSENMQLYCGHQHPFFNLKGIKLNVKDIRNANYAGINVNSPNFLIGREFGFKRSAKVQSEQALAILILSGCYIGFLPVHLAQTYVDQGLMKSILPEKMHYSSTFAAATRRRPEPNRITRLFIEALKEAHPRD